MFNKKLFVTDICLFFISLFFFLIFSIGRNYFTNTTIQVCISFICVLSVILMMIFQYRKINRKINSIRIMNAFIPLALSIALYILYHLPVFGFIGTTGIQNGICGLFVFTLFSRFAFNLSEFLRINYGYTVTPSNLRANIEGRGAITGAYVIAKILKVYAIFVFVGGIAIAMFNAFFSVIDMSVPYQMIFLNKTMTEIFSK